MEYLQYYLGRVYSFPKDEYGFKPCYKWNTFNTVVVVENNVNKVTSGFKPCYKWNTFNTKKITSNCSLELAKVLNLVISGIPSILTNPMSEDWKDFSVLNLVISGIPSILGLTIDFATLALPVLNLVISGIPSIPSLAYS